MIFWQLYQDPHFKSCVRTEYVKEKANISQGRIYEDVPGLLNVHMVFLATLLFNLC